MYSISASIEALSANTTGLQDVMVGLNKSRFWTIVSRSASGILPNFWAVQNKFRAITDAFRLYYDGHEAGNKAVMDAINAQVKLSDALENLNEDLLDNNLAWEEWQGIASESVKEYDAIVQQAEAYIDALDTKGLMEFNDEQAKQIAIQEEVMKNTKDMMSGQKAKLDVAQERIVQKKLDKRELDEADNPVQKFFIKQRQRLVNFAKAINPVLKGLRTFLKNALMWGTVFLLGILVLVNIIKMMWPWIQESRKVFVRALTMIWSGIVNVLGGVFKMVVGALQGDFGKFFEGLKQLGWGMIQLVIGAFGIMASALMLVLNIAWSVLFGKLEEGQSRLARIGKFLFTMVSAILLVVAAITFIATGGWMIALGYLLAAAVAGAIAKVIPGRATGGVVNENMTLVGEKGPELVSLPRGSRVHTSNQSANMMGTTNITVNVQGRIGASDAEVKDMAQKVAREINMRMNRTNTTPTRF